MLTLIVPVVLSALAFGIGCAMTYVVVSNRQGWDKFWEDQNRRRPFAPSDWAGSSSSKVLTYLITAVVLLGGGVALVSSTARLLDYIAP
jgi:hypothetical protein